jgi:hypothetical protein
MRRVMGSTDEVAGDVPDVNPEAKRAGSDKSRVNDTLTVIINGRLNPRTEEELADKLALLVQDDNHALVEPARYIKGQTTIRVSPVSDMKSFSKRIEFTRVIEFDAERRTITIEWPAAANQ